MRTAIFVLVITKPTSPRSCHSMYACLNMPVMSHSSVHIVLLCDLLVRLGSSWGACCHQNKHRSVHTVHPVSSCEGGPNYIPWSTWICSVYLGTRWASDKLYCAWLDKFKSALRYKYFFSSRPVTIVTNSITRRRRAKLASINRNLCWFGCWRVPIPTVPFSECTVAGLDLPALS